MRFGIAGWPALAFLGGTLLAHSHDSENQEPVLPAPETEPDIAPEPQPVPAPPPVAKETPTIPSAASVPIGPPVPAALVDHARRLAADHQARTGARIDTDTLRARLGVPLHLADAIAAQLT
ncbi:hypothetical protein [Streptomyces sp. LN500]|uniref:hypothetical protein n=1 Tax=Streptomyces sp. LN500 TaxID=3112978 RepID=UPI0037147FD9